MGSIAGLHLGSTEQVRCASLWVWLLQIPYFEEWVSEGIFFLEGAFNIDGCEFNRTHSECNQNSLPFDHVCDASSNVSNPTPQGLKIPIEKVYATMYVCYEDACRRGSDRAYLGGALYESVSI